jgi:(hydroxyamino)benzene mutase
MSVPDPKRTLTVLTPDPFQSAHLTRYDAPNPSLGGSNAAARVHHGPWQCGGPALPVIGASLQSSTSASLADMSAPNSLLSRQGRRLLQLGIAFILYSSFDGFVVPFFGSPRIGLSVHTLSALQGIFLLAVGLLWPRLKLSVTTSWIAFWLFIYGAASILAAYTVAAIWGVGIDTILLAGELPHGLTRGTAFQETFIKVLAYSSAPTGLASLALILWGLRTTNERA